MTPLLPDPALFRSVADAADIGLALGDGDDAPCLERVEEVAGLDSLVVRWERELRVDAGAAFFGGVLEPAEQGVRVRDLEIVLAKLNFVLLEHVAVGDTLIDRKSTRLHSSH